MLLDINENIIVLFGWLIRASFQLECIQCTSPIRHVSHNWDHSCLYGTLVPLPCEHGNKSNATFTSCMSNLYRLGTPGNGGVHIHRGCSMIRDARHECDPSASTIDLTRTPDFHCTRTCLTNGCNRDSLKEISSSADGFLNKNNTLFNMCFIIWVRFLLRT